MMMYNRAIVFEKERKADRHCGCEINIFFSLRFAIFLPKLQNHTRTHSIFLFPFPFFALYLFGNRTWLTAQLARWYF